MDTCETCRWCWQDKYRNWRKECRRHAPITNPRLEFPGGPSSDRIPLWPDVDGSHWCGDYEAAP